MKRTRYLRPLVLCALALAVLVSAAPAQTTLTATPPNVSLSYNWYSEVAPSTTTSIVASVDNTVYTAVPADPWVTVLYGGTAGTLGGSGADTLTISIVPATVDALGLPPGSYSSSVALQISAVTVTTVGVTLTVPVSPLSSSASPVALSYVTNGVANQAAATLISTIHDTNVAPDTYSVVAGFPNWLTVTPATGHASSGTPDSCTFTVVPANANGLSAGIHSYTVHLRIAGQSDLPVVVNLTVYAQQPLTTTTTSLSFGFTIGGAATVPVSSTAAIKVASGSQAFTLDQSTVPAWLGVSPLSATANSVAGATITFTPTLVVVKALAAGNYSGSVGFLAAGSPPGSELTIPVTLTVSNATATLSYKGAASTTTILNYPGATKPAPVVTVISSDEPTGFSATCAVSTTNPTYVNTPTSCTLSVATQTAATVTGIAYTYGTALTTTFDNALFSFTVYGAVITETVTITGGAGAPVHQTFIYSVQPIAPLFTALSPTSAANMHLSNDSLVVTLTGNYFLGPGSILNSAISTTKVYVNGADATADAVVINPTTMVLSIPGGSFPAYPAGKTTENLVIGLANQTAGSAPSAPTITQNLVVTQAPVVYAVTSTATYLQPSPGVKPKVVPYELVSIFGANFGMAGNVTGTLSAYDQFGTSVTSGGVTLSVSFKSSGSTTSYKAPILFANATQINLAIPAELTVGQNATITVTAGTASSDGLFAVSVVAADAGIFTLSSDGVGAGAILNHDYSLNSGSNQAAIGSNLMIYMTGLGIPTSAGVDNASNAACVAISDAASGSPGYVQVVNTSNPHATPAYTAPSPAWTSLDGAAINPAMLLGSSLPPCFTVQPSVTFTSGSTVVSTPATYAGFVSGSVAGLYQINVTVPAGVVSGANTVTVTIGASTSPAGVVTVQLQ